MEGGGKQPPQCYNETKKPSAYRVKRYQDTLSYASSKIDYGMGQNIYMLPSNMELKIKTGTVGYNNKILVSDGNFSVGKNDDTCY